MYGNNKCMKIIMKGLKMSKFVVEHFTLCDGWINTWSDGETGEPSLFDTYEEAKYELEDFLDQEAEAYFNGWIEDRYRADEYRIMEVL